MFPHHVAPCLRLLSTQANTTRVFNLHLDIEQVKQIVCDGVFSYNKEFGPEINIKMFTDLTAEECRAQFAVLFVANCCLETFSKDRPVKWAKVKDNKGEPVEFIMNLRRGSGVYKCFFYKRVDVPTELSAGLRFTHQLEVVREVRGTDQRAFVLWDLRDVAECLDVRVVVVDVDAEVLEGVVNGDNLRVRREREK